MVSTGIPGIVFGFLHLFYCIPGVLREFLWLQNVLVKFIICQISSYVMIISSLHQE